MFKSIFKAVQGIFTPRKPSKPNRAVMLKNAQEFTEKWYVAMLEFYKARYDATNDDNDRAAYEHIVANNGQLCRAFMSGYMTAMSNQD